MIAHTPKYNAVGTIDLIWNHPEFGEIPFTASLNDTAYSAELYNRAIAGDFGPIAPYAAPPLSLADFQKAHDNHINSVAVAHKYRDFATFAMRAGYPGPYQAEGIAFAQWMDQCNATGYQILAEVQQGTRVAPTTVEDYIALLPAIPQSLVI